MATLPSDISTFVDLLRWRARQQPEKRIYTFLADGVSETDAFTYVELERRARMIAASLQRSVQPGDRALLIYPSGLEFIAAFFGCLYSNVIAVPVYPPSSVRNDRTLAKFRAIARDAEARAVLYPTGLASRVAGLLAQSPELSQTHVIVTDDLPDTLFEQWLEPQISDTTLAFLQYTSGSTGMPKGVMVSHANLLHNSSLVQRYCQHPEHACGVTWLPLYHDLGLIGGVLQPLYADYESVIMAPTTFLQRPLRWLETVSRTHATISGGPNFAYDLCVRKITDAQKQTLDLSHWEMAANGAEPVRTDTLQRFADAFASCGFRPESFYPCYGLAEATLVVSAGTKGIAPTIQAFKTQDLEHDRAVAALSDEEEDARLLVSIGHSYPDLPVVMVNPETCAVCPDDRVGEIWVTGPSIAQGYWHKPEATRETFHATLTNDTSGTLYMRTGDLGFIYRDELFITGRLKDLIIIRGSNHYPQDIEKTVETSQPALRLNGSAAFSVEIDGEERLAIVAEVERTALSANLDEVVAVTRQAISSQHDLQVAVIVLIKPGSLPKTSSGKVQRRGCKEGYLDGTLDAVRLWMAEQFSSPRQPTLTPVVTPALPLDGAVVDVDLPISRDQAIIADARAIDEKGGAEDATDNKQDLSTQKNRESLPAPEPVAITAAAVRVWLISHVAETLHIAPEAVDPQRPFSYYGLDSVQAVNLSIDLEDYLQREFPPTLIYDYPTIEALSLYLGVDEVPLTTDEPTSQEQKPVMQDIAIIGLSCRFPGASSPEEFWALLSQGIDGISEVPLERWDSRHFYDPTPATPGKMNTRSGGFLSAVDMFDAAFFGIAPREAIRMDPQQRLLLEVAWETFERAGLLPSQVAGSRTGVFVGISSDDYSRIQFRHVQDLDAYTGTGNAHSIAANRLSYVLDLCGPSVAVDTACSSSLLAVHMACQSIRNAECEMALAGGVNLILTPDLSISLSQARMLASSGHCLTFDERADGYVRGEGCGLILLKSLEAAQRDGDPILAVVRGSAVNQDGRSNGLTAPNGPSQEAVIRQALKQAAVFPHEISYVETHGSSTPLGDPIEVAALNTVLMPARTQDEPCFLGAVKTNIGHLEAAAGIAGLIKTVLCLSHGEIVPNLHFQTLNPHINLDRTTFVIPTRRQPWPAQARRLAGVSSFGFGGTNVHVVLEAADEPVPVLDSPRVERPLHVLTLAAQSESVLRALARQYQLLLEQQPGLSVADLCFTANAGRTHFPERLALIGVTAQDLHEKLTLFLDGMAGADILHDRVRHQPENKMAFLFTGQGAQYHGMARELYETQPVYRSSFDRCAEILQPYLDRPLQDLLSLDPALAFPLDETLYTQTALFAVEYALAELWKSWGIMPDVVLGHSIGEYVAACVAGIWSLEDGLKLIATRGRLMQSHAQRGSMLVVLASPARVEPFLAPVADRASLAVINGPQNCVLSGESEALALLEKQLREQRISTHRMVVSHAFHSPLMDPILDEFERVAGEITYQPARIPLVCNVTGQMLKEGETLSASYWRQQTRGTVRFSESMQALKDQGCGIFLEVGPDATLINMGKRCLPDRQIIWLSSVLKAQPDWRVLLRSLAALYIQGKQVDWRGFDLVYSRRRLASLPVYPFARQRYWFDEETEDGRRAQTRSSLLVEDRVPAEAFQGHPLIANHIALAHQPHMHIWENTVDQRNVPYLSDHRIQGAIALPISFYIEMAQAAATEVLGGHAYSLEEIELKKLLLLPEQASQKVQVVLTFEENNQISFYIYSQAAIITEQAKERFWTLHATGMVHSQQ